MIIFASTDPGRSVGKSLLEVVITIAVVFGLQMLSRNLISRIVHRAVRAHKHHSEHHSEVEEKKRQQTVSSIFRTATAVILWVIGIVIILSELHINIAALLTGAGLIGVILGLGAQSTIKSYLAGIFIILENQYRVGDVITLNGLGIQDGVSGVVEDISIRITKLRDLDGNVHIIANGTAGVITNRTFQYAKVNVDIPVGYNSDLKKVEKIINATGAIMAQDEVWKRLILDPIVFLRVEKFNDFSITIKSLGKVQAGAQWDIAGEFRRRIKVAFEENGISISLPQILALPQSKSKE